MADAHPHKIALPTARALNVVGHKWTLLILGELAEGPLGFTETRSRLPGLTNELTRVRLNALVEADLVTRTRYPGVPPRVQYELTDLGREALPILAALADFGDHLPAGADEAPAPDSAAQLERLREQVAA